MERSNRMMLIATCLVGGLGIAFAAGAQSVAAGVQADAQLRTDAAQVGAQADVQADAQASTDTRAADRNPNCLQDTGTRIRARDPATGKVACQGPGRTYSREQIDRTGQTDLADALRRLDPSVH
ncbi:MAG TPA: hypothetical protein VGD42_16105 [Lysobacter sp.]